MHPNIPGGFSSQQAVNPEQQMVDNATSALRARGSRMTPRKPSGNGRMEAITRRLSQLKG